jgi:hypothetical protein
MSQVTKLNYVDNKLGAPSQGQQTTRILFNTIEAPGTTSNLSFFTSFQGLTNGQTNLVQNRLDSMESAVIKTIWLAQYSSAGILEPFGGGFQQTLSILVGNQQVVKDLPIQFNSGLSGQAFDRLHENGGVNFNASPFPGAASQVVQPIEIRMLTDIVIPPQVSFEVRIQGLNVAYGAGAVVCALSGYGKIFSAGNTF